MKINCWDDREDHERPRWEDVPETTVDTPRTEDPNQRRIDELVDMPWKIIKERRGKADDLLN